MKKVIEILFDDNIGMPVFVLEDGSRRHSFEQPTGNCWALSWKLDEEEEAERVKTELYCSDCNHPSSMHHDYKGCVATNDCPCGKE